MSRDLDYISKEFESKYECPDGWVVKNIIVFLRHPTAECIHELYIYICTETDLLEDDDDDIEFSEIAFYVDRIQRFPLNQWDLFDDVIDEFEERITDCITYNSTSESWDFHLPTWFSLFQTPE